MSATVMAAPKPREMMHLNTRSDARGWARLGVHLALILATGWLVAVSPPLLVVPAMLLAGVVQAALFAPIHETCHYTAFKSRRVNAVVGWLVALPALRNWHFYQAFHLAHHKHTQDPEHDPELSPPPPGDLPAYVARVVGLPYWRAQLTVWARGWKGDLSAYPFIHPASAPRVVRSIRAGSALTVVLAVAVGLAFGWGAVLLFWVGPQLLGQPVLRLYLLTEHTGCTEDSNGLTNTRTMMTVAPVRLLMWEMPYHAEHHLYPFIPFHRLKDAHALLRDRLAHVGTGYAAWHRDHIRALRKVG
ncbi:fatty acid desaturase [Roseomonas populi]|uniref:Fatty acid desaturase n=1 Tax=Roseomonas populi TaxID=3121582 RepID=A0ABT1X580_9PROT|nr:fatty acid desaturase [Roseomonas pecuniae]MCR0983261.1 fatty acid desaturase [Roseomonas pecuniae]